MGLESAIKNLLSVSKDKDLLTKFAIERFKEKFFDHKLQDGEFLVYKGFEIISNDKIEVKYLTGYGEMEFNNEFIVNMTEYFREEKLKNILE